MKFTNSFHQIQHNIILDELIPLSKVYEDKIAESFKFDTILDLNFVKELSDELKINLNDFYFNPNAFLDYFVYIGEFFYFALPVLKKDSQLNDFYIKPFKFQFKMASKKYKEKNFSSLLTLIDKPARIHFFNKFYPLIPNEDVKEILIGIYLSSEYGFQIIKKDIIKKHILSSNLTEENIEEIKKRFPIKNNMVTIYRGEQSQSISYKQAYSWSLSKKVAKYFSTRFNEDDFGIIYRTEVSLDDISVYINARDEYEVIVAPEKIKKVKKIK